MTQQYDLPPMHFMLKAYSKDTQDTIRAYAREAIEADRERHDRELAHDWIRPALGLSDDAPYRFDFYAQEIEKLKSNRQHRGEPPVPPSDDTVCDLWVSASDADGVAYDGPSFERGYQCGVVAELDRLTSVVPEWPDFARMEAGLQRLKERLVFENSRRKELEIKLREKRHE